MLTRYGILPSVMVLCTDLAKFWNGVIIMNCLCFVASALKTHDDIDSVLKFCKVDANCLKMTYSVNDHPCVYSCCLFFCLFVDKNNDVKWCIIISVFQVNTYQATIISDGAETFSVLTYNCDQLNWVGLPGAYASVGYSVIGTAEDFRNFASHGLSRSKDVGRIACTNEGLSRPWANVVYKIGVAVNDLQLSRSRCLARVSADQDTFPTLYDFVSQNGPESGSILSLMLELPDCPCSQSQAELDQRFSSDFKIEENKLCFFTRFSRKAEDSEDEFYHRRCCYDAR